MELKATKLYVCLINHLQHLLQNSQQFYFALVFLCSAKPYFEEGNELSKWGVYLQQLLSDWIVHFLKNLILTNYWQIDWHHYLPHAWCIMHNVRREYHIKYIRLLPVLGNTDVQYFTELQYHKKANRVFRLKEIALSLKLCICTISVFWLFANGSPCIGEEQF